MYSTGATSVQHHHQPLPQPQQQQQVPGGLSRARSRSNGSRQQPTPLTPPPSPPARTQNHFPNQTSPPRGPYSPYDSDDHRSNSSSSAAPSPRPPRHSSASSRLSSHSAALPRLPPLPSMSPVTSEPDGFNDRRASGLPGTPGSARRQQQRFSRTSIESASSAGLGSGGGGNDFSFLQSSPPPRSSRRLTAESSSSADNRRPSLMPRSAVTNCFNLDFSFLDDEPPPRPSMSNNYFGNGGGRRTVSDRGPAQSSSRRPISASSERSMASSRLRDSMNQEDYHELSGSRSPGAHSVRSNSSFPYNVSNLPFPSRPQSTRRVSSESQLRATKATWTPGKLVPHLAPDSENDSRRPSIVSSTSSMSVNSDNEPYFGSGPRMLKYPSIPSDLESPTDSNYSTLSQQISRKTSFDQFDQGTDAMEKRKRLAEFLDHTASAMEGGKSLAQVLPEASQGKGGESGKTLSELAEEKIASPRINGPIEYRHPFASTPVVPSPQPSGSASPKGSQSTAGPRTTFAPLPSTESLPGAFSTPTTPTPLARRRIISDDANPDHRRTVYFTPDPNDSASSASEKEGDNDEDHGDDEDEDDDDEDHPRRQEELLSTEAAQEAMRSPIPGLGLGGLDLGSTNHSNSTSTKTISPPSSLNPRQPHPDRSPSTVRASSPASSFCRIIVPVEPLSVDAETLKEREKSAKMAEKRRRTIRELIDTELSYATDMVVVRDIYLARAKGADYATLSDRVMSSGLGLGTSAASPPSPAGSSTFYGVNSSSSSRLDLRRGSLAPSEMRRPSMAPSVADKLSQRRATLAAVQPKMVPSQAVMSPKDIHVVFANLEEIAGLAESFAAVLERANGAEGDDGMDDNIGEVFVEMIPRLAHVYGDYCTRHHRAIIRLQDLEPSLTTYLNECKQLSHGRTNAWDLASLLIKPVQRCLKYPLLLDQILAVTPENHPDRLDLQRANADMLQVAEHINESKKRSAPNERITLKKDLSSARRDSTRSLSAAVSKKLLGGRGPSSVPKVPKVPKSFIEPAERDNMFDTFAALVDSTRSAVLRFSNEMRDWSRSTKGALEAQFTLVEGWVEVHAPRAEEAEQALNRRLVSFLEEVLDPIMEGPYREVDHEVRKSLIVKTDHLLSLFEPPRQFIAKRNDKMIEHSRYLAKKLPADRRGSEEFVDLSTRLLDELPRFLSSVSRYYEIIVGHFGGAQEAYHEAVQERWDAFAEQFDPSSSSYRNSLGPNSQAALEMMNRLAHGLGVAGSQSNSPMPSSRKRISRLSAQTSNSASSSPVTNRMSLPSQAEQQREDRRASTNLHEYSIAPEPRTNRSSVTSDSSTPSFTASNGGSSNGGAPTTPPPIGSASFHKSSHSKKASLTPSTMSDHRLSLNVQGLPERITSSNDHRLLASRFEQPLPSVPIHEQRHYSSSDSSEPNSSVTFREPERPEHSDHYDSEVDLPRPNLGKRQGTDESRYTTTSVYVPAEENISSDDNEMYDEFDYQYLYIAEAMAETAPPARPTYRGKYPILSFRIGERIEVYDEEADHIEGGNGWLLGMKGDGSRGWARTEDFHMLDSETV